MVTPPRRPVLPPSRSAGIHRVGSLPPPLWHRISTHLVPTANGGAVQYRVLAVMLVGAQASVARPHIRGSSKIPSCPPASWGRAGGWRPGLLSLGAGLHRPWSGASRWSCSGPRQQGPYLSPLLEARPRRHHGEHPLLRFTSCTSGRRLRRQAARHHAVEGFHANDPLKLLAILAPVPGRLAPWAAGGWAICRFGDEARKRESTKAGASCRHPLAAAHLVRVLIAKDGGVGHGLVIPSRTPWRGRYSAAPHQRAAEQLPAGRESCATRKIGITAGNLAVYRASSKVTPVHSACVRHGRRMQDVSFAVMAEGVRLHSGITARPPCSRPSWGY